jgi:hypothetical protein
MEHTCAKISMPDAVLPFDIHSLEFRNAVGIECAKSRRFNGRHGSIPGIESMNCGNH